MQALTADLKELRTRFPSRLATTNARPGSAHRTEAVVSIMHGIRDNSDWCRRLKKEIQRLAPGFKCEISSYGNFSIGLFLLFPFRQKNVRWFMDRYTEALALDPGVPTHFVGHSKRDLPNGRCACEVRKRQDEPSSVRVFRGSVEVRLAAL